MSRVQESSCLVGLNGLSHVLLLLRNSCLFCNITPLTSYFEHCHFTLAQTIENLRIGKVSIV